MTADEEKDVPQYITESGLHQASRAGQSPNATGPILLFEMGGNGGLERGRTCLTPLGDPFFSGVQQPVRAIWPQAYIADTAVELLPCGFSLRIQTFFTEYLDGKPMLGTSTGLGGRGVVWDGCTPCLSAGVHPNFASSSISGEAAHDSSRTGVSAACIGVFGLGVGAPGISLVQPWLLQAFGE